MEHAAILKCTELLMIFILMVDLLIYINFNFDFLILHEMHSPNYFANRFLKLEIEFHKPFATFASMLYQIHNSRL